MDHPLNEYLDFAVQTAFEAGRLTLGYFQAGVQPEFKQDETPVTVADREAETHIRQCIESRYPDHSITGEEFGEGEAPADAPRWYIDPIDGTKAFMRGVPLYSVLLGLEISGSIEVGVAYFPGLDESVYAARGEGAYWNGRRCQVTKTQTLDESIISCTNPAAFSQYGKEAAWNRLIKRAYHVSGWSDAYGHALVATGRIEVMADPIMEPYDAGPFPVILHEAGGYFGDWSGNETIHGNEGISTTKHLLPEVLEVLA